MKKDDTLISIQRRSPREANPWPSDRKKDKSYRRLSDGPIGHVCYFKSQASGKIRANHQFNTEYCSIKFQSDHDGKVI